jgi:hypothetical protein
MTSKKRPNSNKATRRSKAKVRDLSRSSQELSNDQAKAVKGGGWNLGAHPKPPD